MRLGLPAAALVLTGATLIAVLVPPAAAAKLACALRGRPVVQARCLSRPILPHGRLGPVLTALPPPLARRVGRPTRIARRALLRLLRAEGAGARQLGGAPQRRLPVRVTYFVLHDTSSPSYGAGAFPSDIDEATWSGNSLARWRRDRRAHVYVTRTGASVTSRAFHVRWRATKRERRTPALRGRLLHVELVQPRRRDPSGAANNEALAPTPGFTRAQLRRAALLYVVASARRGRWLIPAFHAALDAGIRGAHDDPQRFDFDVFTAELRALLATLRPRRNAVRVAPTPR